MSSRLYGQTVFAGPGCGVDGRTGCASFGDGVCDASGVSPQAGLYTAVVAGFLISALGGSRTQIGGPTGAFVVIVAGIVVKFGLLVSRWSE